MSAKRWLSWAAVSSLPQAKKISIDDQLNTNREHCAKHGGQMVAELVVPGESRSIVLFEDAAKRIDAYARLRDEIAARSFDVLVYLDRSRLGRTAALSMTVVALCEEAGIICYETDNPPQTLAINTSYDDVLLGAIKSVGAQQEIRKFTARRASGMLGRAKRGLPPSRLPYGYRREWQQGESEPIQVYAIDESQATIVRQIFDWYLAGRGGRTIAAWLSDAQISPPGGDTWHDRTVRDIIRRAYRYAGYVEINIKPTTKNPYFRGPGQWPAIISDETMQRALTESAERNANRKLGDARHLLSGACRCALCGHAMEVSQLSRQAKRSDVVRCLRHKPMVTATATRIIDAIRLLIDDLRNRDIESMLTDDMPDANTIEVQRRAHAKIISDNARAKSRADAAYVDGLMSADDYATQVRRLRNADAMAQAEIARLDALAADAAQVGNRRQRIEELIEDGLAMLTHPDTTAANAWLRQHIRVHVGRNQIDFEWL